MPFALVLIGLLMIVTGVRNTHAAFGQQIVSDFTGPQNFTTWMVAIGAMGSLGYIEALRPLSRSFMTLIIISFILKNGGVFDKFQEALAKGPLRTAANSKPSINVSGVSQIEDHSAEYIDDLRQSVQSGIAANTAQAGQAQKNFATTLKVGAKLFGLF
jgi:hypothetical protein